MMCLRQLSALTLVAVALSTMARAKATAPLDPESPWGMLADPKKARREVIAVFRAAGGAAPAMLERMAAEDDAHQAPSRPLEDLPPAERLAELIWHLRDEAGWRGANGAYSLFAYPIAGSVPTTCDRIVAFGHMAIPPLLARLDDDRWTRVVYGFAPQLRPRVVPIGAVAKTIIERIADRPFFSSAACRAWWSEVEEKGEFLATADEMDRVAGKYRHYASYLAARLLRMNRVAAAPLVVRACRREKDVLVRKALLDLVATTTGEGVEPFLRFEAASGPMLFHRVAAAFALRDRGLSDPTPAMVREWRRLTDHGQPWPSTPQQWCLDGGIAALAVFLASSGPEGVRTLAEGLGRRPARSRGLVAQVLGLDEVHFLMGGGVTKLWTKADPVSPAPEAESALKAMLGDLEGIERNYAPGLASVRVADLAARSLARRFPERYKFAITAPLADRDAAIATMRR